MSDPTGRGYGAIERDPALDAANYSPPQSASGVSLDVAAQIREAVALALADKAAADARAAAPKVLSPDEEARAHLDSAGSGLGIEERLAGLYRVLDLIAKKVGV